MAKRKKRKYTRKAVAKKFVILWAECGNASQLTSCSASYDETYLFATADEAKQSVASQIEEGNMSAEGTFAIAELLVAGKPSGINWSDNFKSLED